MGQNLVVVRSITVLALVFLAAGCCCPVGSWDNQGSSWQPEPAADPGAPTAPAAGGGACSRVESCCQAFARLVPNTPPNACMGAGMTATMGQESTCTQVIDGYRAGIQAQGQTVPSECQ